VDGVVIIVLSSKVISYENGFGDTCTTAFTFRKPRNSQAVVEAITSGWT
jgi:hypothetical protein